MREKNTPIRLKTRWSRAFEPSLASLSTRQITTCIYNKTLVNINKMQKKKENTYLKVQTTRLASFGPVFVIP